jgi:acetate kinase
VRDDRRRTSIAYPRAEQRLVIAQIRIVSRRICTDRILLSGAGESIDGKEGKFFAQDSRNNVLLSETMSIPSQREAIIRIGRLLADSKMPAPVAVGHRVVHGGPKLTTPLPH